MLVVCLSQVCFAPITVAQGADGNAPKRTFTKPTALLTVGAERGRSAVPVRKRSRLAIAVTRLTARRFV